ncbi:Bcr/CflA family multidrug efflux MFS transporter [Allokutzneria albata]|uniref:MFS transporter, DHA1 family, bicyclomycin/chloramphenicol resistance protein n=1 Tax=Allokutzneria albata TaxID=211114 RepID=A0A1H0BWB8_ALLAB|nr:Bcr/CflA family multidrug efflux MFS transporter [Allokutzneria albata]SDN49952.1 MFS transporter, DHA1 family, bicyclomycin/chloramphenicol resistance protein [Allokutzneria albata]
MRDSNGRIKLVLILGGLSAFGPLCLDMYLPAFPEIADKLGASQSQVQLTLTACMIGLAAGQLVIGPLSDMWGRKRPLLFGVGLFALASLACVFTTDVASFTVVRFVQGFAGAAGIVVARAVVRDLYSGAEAAKFFSTLMLVFGLAPILAPVLGGEVTAAAGWRGVFVTLSIFGALLLLVVALGLPESLPAERRNTGGLRAVGRAARTLFGDRLFIGLSLTSAFAGAALFAYISGSPFVIQDIHNASPQLFSIIFGVNALGFVLVGQLNGRLVGRFGARRLLGIGITVNVVSALALLLTTVIGTLGLVGLLIPLFTLVASIGMISPNALALGMADHPEIAGSASALLGMVQFLVAAVTAPLVGLGGGGTALPMAITIATVSTLAVLALTVIARRRAPADLPLPA